MRRVRVLAAMALAIVLLLASWYALQSAPSDAELPDAAATEMPAAYELMYQRPLSDFDEMTVRLASGESYTVVSDMVFDESGSLLGVRSSLAQPLLVEGQESFALDTTSYQMMLLCAQYLPYTAAYEGLDADACGLSSPEARITVTYREAEPIELSIGSLTASGYSCYVALDGDARVYLVPYDFHQVMAMTLKEHHRLPGALDRSASDAVQVAQLAEDQTMWLATCYADRLLPWQVEKPISHQGSTERIEAYIEGVCALHADAYETSVTDLAGLADYGLDAPQRLVVAFSDGTIRDIHIGRDAGEGQVYARMDSSGDIYRLSRDQLAFLESSGTAGMLNRFVALISSTELNQVTLTRPEGTCALTRTVSGEETAYTMNGEPISAEAFSAIYRALVGLQFDKLTDGSGTRGDLLLQADFALSDGSSQQVTFSRWNDSYVLAETSGGGAFLLRLRSLNALIDALPDEPAY